MGTRPLGVALLLACLATAGCGTMCNLANPRPWEGDRTPFGGVKRDVAWIDGSANGECTTQPKSEYRQVGHMLLGAADLPLSLVGDVVTWPYTCAFTFINHPVPGAPVTPPALYGPPLPRPEPPAPPPPMTSTTPDGLYPAPAPPETPREPGKLP